MNYKKFDVTFTPDGLSGAIMVVWSAFQGVKDEGIYGGFPGFSPEWLCQPIKLVCSHADKRSRGVNRAECSHLQNGKADRVQPTYKSLSGGARGFGR